MSGIHGEPELKMTLICATCLNQYGRFRVRCPVCGTETPRMVREDALKPRESIFRPVRTRERGARDCIFCHRRNAKEKCPHCNEPIHRNCKGLHSPTCEQFQIERNNILNDPANVARGINRMLDR